MLSKQSGGMEYLLSCPIWVESRFAAWISAINELFSPSYLPFFRVACLHVIYIKPDLPNFPVRAKSNNAGFLELCNISFLEGKKIKFSCVCPIPMCPQNLSLLLCFTIFKYLFLNERILSLSFFFFWCISWYSKLFNRGKFQNFENLFRQSRFHELERAWKWFLLKKKKLLIVVLRIVHIVGYHTFTSCSWDS